MPSLPPQEGVAAPPCAGIRMGASTVSTDARLNSAAGTSLPLQPTGEHDAIGSCSGAFGRSSSTLPLGWVNGTLAHILWGVNAIIFPSQLRVFYKHGGGIFPDGSLLYAVGGGDLI